MPDKIHAIERLTDASATAGFQLSAGIGTLAVSVSQFFDVLQGMGPALGSIAGGVVCVFAMANGWQAFKNKRLEEKIKREQLRQLQGRGSE